jgi:DNA-binding transcriptional ArsR family regulator
MSSAYNTAPEPRFARIAAAMADPTRARMLAVLLSGESRSASELARAAGVTPQTASTHLAQLVDAQLLTPHVQGRHRYFALTDADVAHALEALALIAERDNVSARWASPRYAPLKHARKCYGHLAGELGVALYARLLATKRVVFDENGELMLTDAGQTWLALLGLNASKLSAKRNARAAYRCMDWSERKYHLAGSVARALLETFIEKRWLLAEQGSRALTLSAQGKRSLAELFT